jgi:hypothetical protein
VLELDSRSSGRLLLVEPDNVSIISTLLITGPRRRHQHPLTALSECPLDHRQCPFDTSLNRAEAKRHLPPISVSTVKNPTVAGPRGYTCAK